jgi:hypothetical protein
LAGDDIYNTHIIMTKYDEILHIYNLTKPLIPKSSSLCLKDSETIGVHLSHINEEWLSMW